MSFWSKVQEQASERLKQSREQLSATIARNSPAKTKQGAALSALHCLHASIGMLIFATVIVETHLRVQNYIVFQTRGVKR